MYLARPPYNVYGTHLRLVKILLLLTDFPKKNEQ